MAEVQDEDQWLYGDDKEPSSVQAVNKEKDKTSPTECQLDSEENSNSFGQPGQDPPETETPETNGIPESNENTEEGAGEDDSEAKQNGEKGDDEEADNDNDSSSDDDEPTVTIGKIVKQPDIMRPPPPPTHRAAPVSGLKDDDFTSVGKINGIPATEYNLADLEDKPWRKPGADLSDYFNYGFTEDTWIKYCERQKAMRIGESGIGLTGLGVNVSRALSNPSNICGGIQNDNSKYGGNLRKSVGFPLTKIRTDDEVSLNMPSANAINTIQVMTADRRTYSHKVMTTGGSGGYEDLDYGSNAYGDFFSQPPPPFYPAIPPSGPWGAPPPNIPPPGWTPDNMRMPPVMPPVSRGPNFYEEDPIRHHAETGGGGNTTSRTLKDEREMEKIREAIETRERELRHHNTRRRSRSRSKERHRRRSRSRSRSKSPSHRHKRKKSKREREAD